MHIKLVQYICPKFHPEKTGASFLLPCLSFLGVMRGQILFCLVLILQPSCSHVLIELFLSCSDSLCVTKFEGRFFPVNTLLNVSCDVRFIVLVNLNSSLWYDGVDTKEDISSYGFRCPVDICIIEKDVPVCREETSFKFLNIVIRPHLYSWDYWFAGLKD